MQPIKRKTIKIHQKTQTKDIKLAKTYLNDYLQGENHG